MNKCANYSELEESGELDLDSELDLWCFRAIFLPIEQTWSILRVSQRHFNYFHRSWNNHGLFSMLYKGITTTLEQSLLGILSLQLVAVEPCDHQYGLPIDQEMAPAA